MRCIMLALMVPVLVLAQDPPAPKENEEDGLPISAAARLGRLRRAGERIALSTSLKLPPSALPKLEDQKKSDDPNQRDDPRSKTIERLKKACTALPSPKQLTTKHLLELYRIAGPSGVHYLYDKKLLSEEHARSLKDLRDALNDEILRKLTQRFGYVLVNNFGSGKNCRSDHDQTLFADPPHTPQKLIDAYNELFRERLRAEIGEVRAENFDPSIIELSNFDGCFGLISSPSWRNGF